MDMQTEENKSKDSDDKSKVKNPQDQPPKYWLSLEQWRHDEGFKELAQREFMSSPLSEDELSQEGSGRGLEKMSSEKMSSREEGGWARREFLQLMGASLALSTFGCVRRPIEKIIPYVNRPKEIIPGLP